MDILIKNMVLPTEDEQVNITILSDGSIIEHFRNESGKWSSYRSGGVKAVALTPHGELIDRNALIERIGDNIPEINTPKEYLSVSRLLAEIGTALTIVEANNGTDN